jgi:anti-sigma factor (TIGR02949 family)
MECPDVAGRIWEYLDGELPAKEAGAVELHVADCPRCRSHCRRDRAFLLVLVRSFHAPCPAPPRLRARIIDRLGLAGGR